MNGWKNWILAIVGSLAGIAIVGALGVAIAVARADERIEDTEKLAEETAKLSHTNAIAVAQITQWIELDRARELREYNEGVAAHSRIEGKLDDIETEMRKR